MTHYRWLALCYLLSESFYLKLVTTCKNLFLSLVVVRLVIFFLYFTITSCRGARAPKKVLWKIINPPISTGVFIAGIFQGGWGSMDPHIYFMVNIMQHMLTHIKSLLHLKYFTGVSTRNRMISEQAPVYWWKSKKKWSESRFSEELRNRVSKKNFIKSRMIWHFNTEIFHFGFFPLWFVTKMWKVSSETKSTFYSAQKRPKRAKYIAKKVWSFWKVLAVPRKNSMFSGLWHNHHPAPLKPT